MDVSAIVAETIMALTSADKSPDENVRLKEDLGMDSLSLTRLIVELEERLNIEIDLRLLTDDNLETVADVRKLVEKSVAT